MDGFIPRRAGTQLGRRQETSERSPFSTGLRVSANKPVKSEPKALKRTSELGLTRADVSESLKDIDTIPAKKDKKQKGLGVRPGRVRWIVKRLIVLIVIVLIVVGGWIGWRAVKASGNIFKGNVLGLIQATPLKQDASGRTSVLVLGTSEDDPGHGGAYLTDSMMVLTANQKEKTAAMFSIPRDLYVDYGMACNSGYKGKINEYFNCVNDDWDSKGAEEERLEKTREFVGKIFGLDIQYAVHINNTVLKEAVDAVDGVDVDIEGSGGAPGILDRNFDWRCNYKCNLVKYDNGVHHLDGEHALFLAMARGDDNGMATYGLGNSNFDREKNQQKILLALKSKAVSLGSLTNIGQVTGLINALGDNLRTTFATDEIRTLMQLGIDVKPENIQRISLNDSEQPMVAGANFGGSSVVVPVAGAFRYESIRAYIAKHISADAATREGAKIAVLNGSGVGGAAQSEADKLSENGLTVTKVDNAPEGTYAGTLIYRRTKEMNATKAKLESLYGVKVVDDAPIAVDNTVDFIVIVGVTTSSR